MKRKPEDDDEKHFNLDWEKVVEKGIAAGAGKLRFHSSVHMN